MPTLVGAEVPASCLAQQLLGVHISGAQDIVLACTVVTRFGEHSGKPAELQASTLLLAHAELAACLPAAGADVTHPMGFNKIIPSIASVVASLNRHATIYCERSRLQAHRTEIIQVRTPLQPGAVQLPQSSLPEPLQLPAHRNASPDCHQDCFCLYGSVHLLNTLGLLLQYLIACHCSV